MFQIHIMVFCCCVRNEHISAVSECVVS